VPELPEVERARAAIESAGLGRRIADVDDTDTYECRPHAPGEIREALLGRSLTAAHRRGKTMWCDTSGVGRSRTPGPILGLHLGMAGRIVISPAGLAARTASGRTASGRLISGPTAPVETVEGGDPRPRRALPGETRWNRFTLFFADGGSLVLLDPRRLGRVRLDPAVDVLGPDALTINVGQFRVVMTRGTAPVKARLLDQTAIAGVGNLLADEALWQALIDPHRPVQSLTATDVTRLHRAVRRAVAAAVRLGGAHTGDVISHRRPGGQCPRCGTELRHGTVGGRSTWWCPLEQV
jgi:formamidopyrimidine-DNA glycosylase